MKTLDNEAPEEAVSASVSPKKASMDSGPFRATALEYAWARRWTTFSEYPDAPARTLWMRRRNSASTSARRSLDNECHSRRICHVERDGEGGKKWGERVKERRERKQVGG